MTLEDVQETQTLNEFMVGNKIKNLCMFDNEERTAQEKLQAQKF